MSHPEQLRFFELAAAANRHLVPGSRILEIGSYDVNGTMRARFDGHAHYVGVDLVAGPGVDHVGYGHELDAEEGSFDIAASGECFEHDPHWQETFATMVRLTRPGGLVVFTCAGPGRPEHGTSRTRTRESPGTQFEGLDYYRNLDAADFEASHDLAADFSDHRFFSVESSFDLYFAGVRAGTDSRRPTAELPAPDDVDGIEKMMSRGNRLVRLPARVIHRAVPESRYQDVVLWYWRPASAMFLKWREVRRRLAARRRPH